MMPLAFTIEAPGILENIITPVSVCQAERLCQLTGRKGESVDVAALWDTGANHSCVSARLAKRLGLVKIDTYETAGINGVFSTYVYLLDINLPNAASVRNVKTAEFIDDNDFDIIIGMDIITCGDFAISNYDRKTVVSFRIPSQKPPIDFRKANP